MAYPSIGTIEWSRRTGGSLSLKDRLTLMRHVLAPSFVAATKTWLHLGKAAPVTLDSIPRPDTAAMKSAYATLEACASPAIINHSLRTYYWGAAFGRLTGVLHDPELLMASCLLHDLGMTPAHHGQHAGCTCFAVEGGVAARAWAAQEGWPSARQERLEEAISLHMNCHVTVENGAEAHLLQRGAACDVVGARLYDIDPSYRQTILEKYPRHGLNRAFLDFVERESSLRPQSRTHLMRWSGFALLVHANPFTD